jgi:hypothetical protein
MVEFEAYGSWEEMMEAELQARKIADSRVQDWQRKARAGEILVSQPYRDLIVFHEILDNEKIVGENLKKYGDDYEEEGMHVLDLYCFNTDEWNYRFCNNYSQVVPEGELGDIHLSIAIGKVHRDEFEKLKSNGFSTR